MAENRRLSIELPWATLLKIIAAVALVAIIVAVGLQPAVAWLERRGFARWVAASTVVFLLFIAIVGFLGFTWTTISGQPQDVGTHLQSLVREGLRQLPTP